MRIFLAIAIGKAILFVTRFLKIGGGSAAPGLYALKIEPKLIEKLVKQVSQNIVITGTNGKTTTARTISYFANEARLKVISNSTGSNLERGIGSALIAHLGVQSKNEKSSYDLGIWEVDEAAFNIVAPKIKPDAVVFLNLFKDQLDRYGEIDSIVKNWHQTLSLISSKTKILVNGDDIHTLKLKEYFENRVQTFGVKDFKIFGEAAIKPTCEKLDYEAIAVKQRGLTGSSFQLSVGNSQLYINLPIPGLYHIYDAVAAIGCFMQLGLPIHKHVDVLSHFSPAFGRFEKLPFGHIFLIKNPIGATQVFQTIASEIKVDDKLLIALNDHLADGTDISWIWDGEFERLCLHCNRTIIVSGSRAHDLAVRIKYAGFSAKSIIVEPDLKRALKEARKGLKGNVFILPTYTALLQLQNILAKIGLKQYYWNEKF